MSRLGYISEQFESAWDGPGVISNVPNDPGGKSYGIFQLSRATLRAYLADSVFKFTEAPLSAPFDKEWTTTAHVYATEFDLDQWIFVTRKLYLPRAVYAHSLGYKTSNRLIQEAVYSIAVQHGKATELLRRAYVTNASPIIQVESLYAERWKYVQTLSLTDRIKEALQRRYLRELSAVLKIAE